MTTLIAENTFWPRLQSALRVVTIRNWVVILILIASAIVVGYPFIWMLSVSFQPGSAAYRLPPDLTPDEPSLESYKNLFESNVPFLRAYWNSIVVAAVSTTGVIVSSAMAAFAFSRLEFRGNGALFGLMLVGLMVPPSLVLIPLFFEFAAINLLGSVWSLIIPSLVSPLGVYMLRQFMISQPREFEEAALIEGASYWSIFRRVSLPQMSPAIASLAIISFTQSWNNFLLPLVFVRTPDQMTLPLAVFSIGFRGNAVLLSTLMASVTLSIAPLFLVFLVAQRYIVEGLTRTGIKG